MKDGDTCSAQCLSVHDSRVGLYIAGKIQRGSFASIKNRVIFHFYDCSFDRLDCGAALLEDLESSRSSLPNSSEAICLLVLGPVAGSAVNDDRWIGQF
jgi:hypothetical protein